MALTIEGTLLTTQHQQAQIALRARILQALLQLWPNFDVRDIDASWDRLGPALMALTDLGRQASTALSQSYYQVFRDVEGVTDPLPDVRLGTAWRPAAETSYRVTGPVTAKHLIELNRPDVAQQALVRVSGALQRHVLNGGREYIFEATKNELRRVGWARVTSRKPCYFCAMLASRGPIYTSRGAASFQAHDHCVCTVEPVFRDNAKWPGQARDFQELWVASTRDTQGKDSIRAFRRAYEGRLTP